MTLKMTMYHNILDVIQGSKSEIEAAQQIAVLFEKYLDENTKPLGPEDMLDSELGPKPGKPKGTFWRVGQ